MKPQTIDFLAKAQKLLNEADVMLKVALNDAAGRTAYLAAFHAAHAFVFEQTQKISKSHNGLHAEFARLTKNDARMNNDLRSFLSRSYNLKAIADYETGFDTEISSERATQAVEKAKLFVDHLTILIST
jgi:uncharacterized protein (UPF0332 family)